MAYIGSTPTTQSFVSGTDYFNGTGSQTAFTLTRAVNSVNDIEVVVNSVVQRPNSGYTVSGTTLTFDAAPSSGTNNVYVRYLSTTIQTIAPSQNSVGWNQLDTNTQQDLGISFKNRITNSNMAIDQRNAGASQTITAAAALAYTVDRWYAYCTGANVTGQRVAGTGLSQFRYQFTGAASVTKIGFTQRIEQLNSYDLNNQTVTLSVDLANSLLTTVTWVASYANTANTFGTLASPTVTQIATGTFTVSSTINRYSTTISIPAAATTGLQIEFSVAAQTSGTWTIGNVQLEVGTQATAFSTAGGSYGAELALCQRYYARMNSLSGNFIGFGSGVDISTTAALVVIKYPTTMRAAPTLAVSNVRISDGTTDATVTSLTTTWYGSDSLLTQVAVASGLAASRGCVLLGNNNAAAYVELSSEL